MICQFCGRHDEGNAGDYYHRKQCHQKDVLKRIAQETDPQKLEILRQELSDARYVGD